MNKQKNEILNYQDSVDELVQKNTSLLDQVDEYRAKCHQLTESLTGIHENLADSGLEYRVLEDENNELKDQLCILGLTYIDARCRGLHRFNRITRRYNHQRNIANQAEQALVLCQTHGNFLRSQELYGRLTIRAQKRHNVTLLTEKFAQRQLILNLRGQIILLQNNPLPNPLLPNMAAI